MAMILPGHGGPVEIPAQNDVLSGRGGGVNGHTGNRRYRALVASMKTEYNSPTTRKLEKTRIAARIVHAIRRYDPPGRFLKEDTTTSGIWREVGDAAAIRKVRKKTGQALREKASEYRTRWMIECAWSSRGLMYSGMNNFPGIVATTMATSMRTLPPSTPNRTFLPAAWSEEGERHAREERTGPVNAGRRPGNKDYQK